MINRGAWISIVFLVAANLLPMPARVTSSERPTEATAFERASIPLHLGAWSGKHLEVDERTVDILETEDVALMEYTHPQATQPVWLAQVAGVGQRAAYHPPELCYIGSHFEVMEREPIQVKVQGKSVPVMRLVLSKKDQFFEAWYWFTAGERITVNYYEQQFWLVWSAFKGEKSEGSLVRISSLVDDKEATHERLKDFLIKMQQERD